MKVVERSETIDDRADQTRPDQTSLLQLCELPWSMVHGTMNLRIKDPDQFTCVNFGGPMLQPNLNVCEPF